MPAVISVVYPTEQSADFNLDYYMKVHMPLVQSKWGPHGLQSWSVCTFDPATSPYRVQALLYFDSVEAFKKAAATPEEKEVMADVINFTSAKPVLMVGNVVGSGPA